MDDLVKRLRDRQSMKVWTGTGDTPRQALFADTLCREAAAEIERLRRELDAAINAADRAIEHARRVDAKERDALRKALLDLVQIYVVDGAAMTRTQDIGHAWTAARRALGML